MSLQDQLAPRCPCAKTIAADIDRLRGAFIAIGDPRLDGVIDGLLRGQHVADQHADAHRKRPAPRTEGRT